MQRQAAVEPSSSHNYYSVKQAVEGAPRDSVLTRPSMTDQLQKMAQGTHINATRHQRDKINRHQQKLYSKTAKNSL